jgi:hypothetical protein
MIRPLVIRNGLVGDTEGQGLAGICCIEELKRSQSDKKTFLRSRHNGYSTICKMSICQQWLFSGTIKDESAEF